MTISLARTHEPITVAPGKDRETVRLVELPLAIIQIPPFQRPRIDSHIKKLASEFDLTASFGIMVALFKTHYICLDGQQRLAATEILGIDRVSVGLIEGIGSQERLAELFLRFNRDRKLVAAFDKFVAALEAKDRGSLDVQRVLEQFDLEVGRKAGADRLPTGSVVRIHETGGTQLLERVIRVITEAWPTRPIEAHEGQTLLGVSSFIYRYRAKLDDDRLISILSANHPGWLITQSRYHGTFVSNYVNNLREAYNKGVRGKARLD